MSCGVGHRHGLNPALLWLWCRPEATGPIQPLGLWEPPYALDAALKRPKKKNSYLVLQRQSVGAERVGLGSQCISLLHY